MSRPGEDELKLYLPNSIVLEMLSKVLSPPLLHHRAVRVGMDLTDELSQPGGYGGVHPSFVRDQLLVQHTVALHVLHDGCIVVAFVEGYTL